MTEINFKGKEFVYNHHLTVPFRPLVPDAGRGIGPVALDGNLIVHGDNLHALKALLPQYAGKVDCVFIDPPYNTGNEGWCYNDNVNAPMIREWLAASPVGIEDGLRHDKWCVMMWPRLRLLHELLSEDGSFWMTLDDNEAHRGKLLLDEIFGEKNFIANVVWQKKYSPQNDAKWFSDNHDHILVYAKTRERWRPNLLPRSKEMDARYENPDNDPKGPWKLITLHAKSGKDRTLEYTFFNGVKWKPPHGTYPRFSAETLKQYELEGKIWFGKDGNSIPSVKNYLSEVKAGVTPLTIWEHSSVGHNHEAKTDIKNVLGANPFDTPKPVKLIERVLRIASNKNSVILDSFAGSGTTAHAVLEANRRDGGNRRFILVEMEEDIADAITAERVRRVINGYPFKGTQKTELLREKITWTRLKKAQTLINKVDGIENLHGHEYDTIKKTVKDGELIVTGEKAVQELAEGLDGSFTYCTLGKPADLDKVLGGKSLPAFEDIGSVLFNTATARALDPAAMRPDDFYLGRTEGEHVWLFYKPDLDWLKSPDAALTTEVAEQITATDADARHLVFAPSRHVSQRTLSRRGLPVEFVPLPFAIYHIDRS